MNCAPPLDYQSFQIMATEGCSHNKCSFCTMFKEIPFRPVPLEEIENQLSNARGNLESVTRVFLASGNAFILPADRLLRIANLIHGYLPNVKTIAAYATVRSIMIKSDEELASLAKAGFGHLDIGLESGLDEVHTLLNKGTSLSDAKTQMLRLKKAGMPFSVNIIAGAAGAQKIPENAKASAEICNEINPDLIYYGPLIAWRGSKISEMIEKCEFNPINTEQFMAEQQIFIENLDVSDSIYYANHGGNPMQLIGLLPKDKDNLLNALLEGKKQLRQSGLLNRKFIF